MCGFSPSERQPTVLETEGLSLCQESAGEESSSVKMCGVHPLPGVSRGVLCGQPRWREGKGGLGPHAFGVRWVKTLANGILEARVS